MFEAVKIQNNRLFRPEIPTALWNIDIRDICSVKPVRYGFLYEYAEFTVTAVLAFCIFWSVTREDILLAITVPVYTIAITAELYLGYRSRRENYDTKDTFMSLWFGFAGAGTDLLMKSICFLVLNWCNLHAIYKPDLLTYYLSWHGLLCSLPRISAFTGCTGLSIPPASSGLRIAITIHLPSIILRWPCALQCCSRYAATLFYVPIAFLGFDGLTIMFMYAVNQFYQFWLHTETIGKLPRWY